jgi:hypothetical protein
LAEEDSDLVNDSDLLARMQTKAVRFPILSAKSRGKDGAPGESESPGIFLEHDAFC